MLFEAGGERVPSSAASCENTLPIENSTQMKVRMKLWGDLKITFLVGSIKNLQFIQSLLDQFLYRTVGCTLNNAIHDTLRLFS